MKRTILTIMLSALALLQAAAFSYLDGRASLSPYPTDRQTREFPDSLTPIFVNHVGRHGSRYPAGPGFTLQMKAALEKADSLGTITPLGRRLLNDVNRVVTATAGRWGQLDTIGEAEHRGIAGRLYRSCPQLLDSARVVAMSSYSPRSAMSMYAFVNQLQRMAKGIDVTTASGKRFSPLFLNQDADEQYKAFRADTAYQAAYKRFLAKNVTMDPLMRALGADYPFDYATAYDLQMAEYYVLAGMNAMGLDCDPDAYFKPDEYQRLWSIFNFRQYLGYSASVLSTRPVEIAAPLLQDIVLTADSVISGRLKIAAKLRFGHAETMMPLMALIQAPGCFYLTNYFDSVADRWQDYAQFPMAANLQLVYFRAPSGKVYVRADFNERPIALQPGNKAVYVPWDDLRLRLLELLPLE